MGRILTFLIVALTYLVTSGPQALALDFTACNVAARTAKWGSIAAQKGKPIGPAYEAAVAEFKRDDDNWAFWLQEWPGLYIYAFKKGYDDPHGGSANNFVHTICRKTVEDMAVRGWNLPKFYFIKRVDWKTGQVLERAN